MMFIVRIAMRKNIIEQRRYPNHAKSYINLAIFRDRFNASKNYQKNIFDVFA